MARVPCVLQSPSEPTKGSTSYLRDVKQHVVQATSPWSAFKGAMLLSDLCLRIRFCWCILNNVTYTRKEQTLLCLPAKKYVICDRWTADSSHVAYCWRFGLLEILPVCNQTKEGGKTTPPPHQLIRTRENKHRREYAVAHWAFKDDLYFCICWTSFRHLCMYPTQLRTLILVHSCVCDSVMQAGELAVSSIISEVCND